MKFKFSKRINNYVVIYDILSDKRRGWISAANRRRTKVSRILMEYGVRTQKSVFEIEINTQKDFNRLIRSLQKIMTKDDKIYIYPIDSKSLKRVRKLGSMIEYDFFF
ncbi:CRISPR-associated endonuclease Cas2 [Desulfurobacterium atlanticum]|uniref:CRISPR-associated endoribonuclease Cas2 n=1 Tax=Desulfurobacterium atlanticum TaxID=240169 RepID=A0A238Y4M0_9BACT|nr:CRISPR-associated endonuclease Cas2 [Desulfurobacterium atlanticum]SNR65932.1 CRISPR-associated protein, Cas2 family [Desulfurobacterium atlanticum]